MTTYLYDGNAILMEMDGAGQVTARYTHGPAIDWPLLMEREGQALFYHADALGSVVALTDASGSVVRSYAYDSWGRPQGTEAAGPANPFLFAGREYDAETSLYYFRARYYDSATGRFISQDPLDLTGLLLRAQDPSVRFTLLPASAAALAGDAGGGPLRVPQQLNPYSYAFNNPLAFRDPSGLRPGKCGAHVFFVTDNRNFDDPFMLRQEILGQGYIQDFEGWLFKNGYTTEYRFGGNYAEIVDTSGATYRRVGMVSIAYVGYKYRPELASDEWFEAAAAYPGKVWQAITEVNKTQHEVLFGP